MVAPAGFGKTVMLSAWVACQPQSRAWLTLTRHDLGDEGMLLAGVLSALQRLPVQGAPTPAYHGDGEGTRALIGRISELVMAWPTDVVLVVDDAHHAGPRFVEQVVGVLAPLTEGKLRFVLCGQVELTSWFAGAIAAQEVAVIGADGLAFTSQELLTQVADVDPFVEPHAVEALIAATGGWPIAVQLHRLTKDLPPAVGSPDWLLTDYVTTNVLGRLDPEISEFIVSTSVCSRLSPALARTLSGADDAEALLEACVARGLFLTWTHDGDGTKVYRWHEEFAARCRDYLARTDGARFAKLDVAAARYLAARFPAEAVFHALRADQPKLAAQIIQSSWVKVIIESGAATLNAQCHKLQQYANAYPELLLVRACCLNQMGDEVGGELAANQAARLGGHEESFQMTSAFAGLFLANSHAELAAAVDAASGFLEHGGVPAAMYPYCLFLLGWAELRLRRDTQRAVRFLETALRDARTANLPILAGRIAANLLFALAYAGNFAKARDLLEMMDATLDRSEDWHFYDGGIEIFARGFLDFWQDDLVNAERSFRLLVDSGGHGASYAALGRVYLAYCAAIGGKPGEIRAAHEQILAISKNEMHGIPWPVYRTSARAELFAGSGDMPRALELMGQIRAQLNVPIVRVFAADLMRRAGRLGDAVQMLATLTEPERATSYVLTAAHVSAALIAHERGDSNRAHRHLEWALDAAVPEGVLRPFALGEERLTALLIEHASAGTAHEEFVAMRIGARTGAEDQGQALGIPLSAREREVYGYLCTTMTVTEISEVLFVSVNTVRTHQRAIYRKLGVANRREAIRLAL